MLRNFPTTARRPTRPVSILTHQFRQIPEQTAAALVRKGHFDVAPGLLQVLCQPWLMRAPARPAPGRSKGLDNGVYALGSSGICLGVSARRRQGAHAAAVRASSRRRLRRKFHRSCSRRRRAPDRLGAGGAGGRLRAVAPAGAARSAPLVSGRPAPDRARIRDRSYRHRRRRADAGRDPVPQAGPSVVRGGAAKRRRPAASCQLPGRGRCHLRFARRLPSGPARPS